MKLLLNVILAIVLFLYSFNARSQNYDQRQQVIAQKLQEIRKNFQPYENAWKKTTDSYNAYRNCFYDSRRPLGSNCSKQYQDYMSKVALSDSAKRNFDEYWASLLAQQAAEAYALQAVTLQQKCAPNIQETTQCYTIRMRTQEMTDRYRTYFTTIGRMLEQLPQFH